MSVKGYKVFKHDWTCKNGFQYEIGKIYEMDDFPKCCVRGFHFCEKAANCFNCCQFNPENKVAEVIALGEVDSDGTKSCTNKIQIVREIPWKELLEIVNTGNGCTGLCNSGNYNSGYYNSGNQNSGNFNSCDYNSGYWNSGNRNSGDHNSGDYNSGNFNSGHHNSGICNNGYKNSGNWNSGNYNSGNRNSGNYNSGNHNSGNHNSGDYNSGDWNTTNFSNGCFNTVEQKIYMFNKPSEWTRSDWLKSEARHLLNQIPGVTLEYIWLGDMTDEEKAAYPEAETTGGCLKKLDNSEHKQNWWHNLSDRDKGTIMAIPNFDKDIFKKITGIDVTEQ